MQLVVHLFAEISAAHLTASAARSPPAHAGEGLLEHHHTAIIAGIDALEVKYYYYEQYIVSDQKDQWPPKMPRSATSASRAMRRQGDE
jgi:hypothetical protein